jgi:hypothetical protein
LVSLRSFSDAAANEFCIAFNALSNDIIINENSISPDPNGDFYDFVYKFETLVDNFFPIKDKVMKYNKTRAPWITTDLLKCINKKHRIYRKYKRGIVSFSRFKIFRNMLIKALRVSKRNYYFHKINSNNGNMKQMWKTINSLRKPYTSNKSFSLKIDDEIVTDNQTIANKFNDHFLQLPIELKSTIPISSHVDGNLNNIDRNCQSFCFFPINENEVLRNINVLKDTNFHTSSAPPRLMKLVANRMSCILAKLFNGCIANSIFPDILKIAKVIPIPKNAGVLNISNYRPISILSSFTKIFEKIIYERLYSFFVEFNLFNEHQYGFIKGKGIEDAIINILYILNESVIKKEFTLVTFLDFSKAFDMVPHARLLSKLNLYGVRGVNIFWILLFKQNAVCIYQWGMF